VLTVTIAVNNKEGNTYSWKFESSGSLLVNTDLSNICNALILRVQQSENI